MSSHTTSPLRTGAKAALCIGALGVVFGDIGTSPLYTMKECMAHLPDGVDQVAGVFGVLSLIFWLLVLVVSVKYLWFVMSADNQGEGGIFALLALLQTGREPGAGRGLGPTIMMILVGAALLYGDGIITPAITVLGAAEGLATFSPSFTPGLIALIACIILAGLFWVQRLGTKSIGGVFGPIMVVWFAVIGVLGARHIAANPTVLRALNPAWGLALLRHSPLAVSALLGAIVLAITGAEALYADMGHFGRRYIALAWYGAAFPGLVLNYFGQGAYILNHPTSPENPFFALAAPGLMRVLLTSLSIVAAIVASQALISGAYSLTRQAIQLGYFPRLKINFTNIDHSGQIYVPFVNALLAVGSIYTVVLFQSTDRLAAAYGIAVTGTMAITTIAYYLVTQKTWPRARLLALPICTGFLLVDLAFFFSNSRKIAEGGWFPLAIGLTILAVMHAWKVGRQEVYKQVYGKNQVNDAELTEIASSARVTRVVGSSVFMVGSPNGTPVALLHHVRANRCLHKVVVILSILTEEVPTVAAADQLEVREVGEGIWRAVGRYGYMQSPDVGELLKRVRDGGVPIKPDTAIYFFNREMIMYGGNAPMRQWQKALYALLSRNAQPVKDYYQITPLQIIEIGLPVPL